MLSESVIENLTRRGKLAQTLVEMAWPDLSVESRLQVIETITRRERDSLPTWLVHLAMGDQAPIVRFWAAKCAYLPKRRQPVATDDPEAAELNQMLASFAPGEEAVALRERVQNDSHSLVRECVDLTSTWDERFPSMTQEARLLRIRTVQLGSLSRLIRWLKQGMASGVPDADLGGCVAEHFQRQDLEDPESVTYYDGMDAYSAGSTVKEAWELIREAGPSLTMQLAWHLPTHAGMYSLSVEEMLSLPPQALEHLLTRPARSREIESLRVYLREHPEKVPEGVSEFRPPSARSDYESELHRRREAPNPGYQTLELGLQLKRSFRDMDEKLDGAVQAIQKRRGIFW